MSLAKFTVRQGARCRSDRGSGLGRKLVPATTQFPLPTNNVVKRRNIYRVSEWFKVLQTTPRTQTAVMKLGQGQATGGEPEAHEKSDQVILLIAGELSAQIDGKRCRMKPGDVLIIPPRVKHRFTNSGEEPAITFNVYSPPEYSADEK
jgi:mannose-6-phosphate isomerase-like protein (cupin superfamily)